ncbi:MAG: RNase adapter RapZ [Candidatus Pelagadaptatus aseana]|uniref:RNase adapter RapZ n=1 Tax=Candidatus Pelagadaptatus aseana TaxID=3120508 RepID=UPI0039B2FCF2
MRLIVISGRSGSGKSTALHVLEDAGFNCIDNLPAALLPNLVNNISEQQSDQNIAVSIDARNASEQLQRFPEFLKQAQQPGLSIEILFLDARSPILIKRFSETRRKHPLSNEERDLKEAVTLESELLDPIALTADLTIDTSNLSLHQLRDLIKNRITEKEAPGIALQFQSFGFKHGIPVDVDFVFDVRCLPNPYWKPNLRKHTGQEQPVIDFLSQQEDVQTMLDDITRFIERWLPKFIANNRSYMTVAIGCTGGHHRSVFLCEQLYNNFKNKHGNTQLRHRELNKYS